MPLPARSPAQSAALVAACFSMVGGEAAMSGLIADGIGGLIGGGILSTIVGAGRSRKVDSASKNGRAREELGRSCW